MVLARWWLQFNLVVVVVVVLCGDCCNGRWVVTVCNGRWVVTVCNGSDGGGSARTVPKGNWWSMVSWCGWWWWGWVVGMYTGVQSTCDVLCAPALFLPPTSPSQGSSFLSFSLIIERRRNWRMKKGGKSNRRWKMGKRKERKRKEIEWMKATTPLLHEFYTHTTIFCYGFGVENCSA